MPGCSKCSAVRRLDRLIFHEKRPLCMLSTRSVCKAVTSAGGSGNALDESEYCAFGLEYCRKCYPNGVDESCLRLSGLRVTGPLLAAANG